MLPQPSLSKSQVAELAVLTRRFIKSMEAQRLRDHETVASLTRVLLYPEGEHAERLIKLIKSIALEKDTSDDQHCRK